MRIQASATGRVRRLVWCVALGVAAALLLWVPAAPAATNNIFTVAGTGTAGFSGDGGLATAAQLDTPTDVAATADGGFLVADGYNDRVRRVSPAGTITTVAGDGTSGFGATAARPPPPSSTGRTGWR